MFACGAPLLVSEHESAPISLPEFLSSCHWTVQELREELEDDRIDTVDDEEIRVDDLRILSDEELVQLAIEDKLKIPNDVEAISVAEETAGGNHNCRGTAKRAKVPRSKKRKTMPANERAKNLEIDARMKATIEKIMQDREDRRRIAADSLHSLREESTEAVGRKLRHLGKLRLVTSILRTPIALPSTGPSEELHTAEEVVLTIDFHGPSSVKVQEFVVLGRQTLTVLKDQLYCSADEVSTKAGIKAPSGYFLIESVFYNDMRDPEAVDYSRNIISWIEEQNRLRETDGAKKMRKKLLEVKSARMEETSFRDCNFRIGARYYYCHQGDCKHLFVVRDVRLLHADDEKSSAAYPLLKFLPRLKHRKCTICDIYHAKKVTYDDKLAPSNPCFFCIDCYNMLHCSEDGELLYSDFRVEDYILAR